MGRACIREGMLLAWRWALGIKPLRSGISVECLCILKAFGRKVVQCWGIAMDQGEGTGAHRSTGDIEICVANRASLSQPQVVQYQHSIDLRSLLSLLSLFL